LTKVGLNLLYLVPRQVGGTEIYARRLIAALGRRRPEDEFVVFCGNEAAATLPDPEWTGNVRVRRLPVNCANKPLRLACELGQLPLAAAAARVDVLHSLGTTTPFVTHCPRLVTVHDLIYEAFPETFPTTARLGLKAVVPLGARRADRVITDSRATRTELLERFGLDPARVDAVHLGLGMREARAPAPEPELRRRFELGERPVVLTVAAALAHKNLDRLLEAMTRVEGDAALVMVGHAGRDAERLLARAAELGIDDRFRLTGWVENAELEGLYRLARAFVYPSLHEGFGMPVLEAMHRGVPTACADATSLPEVAGDAGLLFDPRSVDAIAAAVSRLLADAPLRERLSAAGIARAASFTWEACADGTWASYERALGSGGPSRGDGA
jgi:glycosyltransferase involved in cell wall biosynthesis